MRVTILQSKRAFLSVLFTLLLSLAGVTKMQAENIAFADSNVKAICVNNWDTDGDGELSYVEAAAVTNLGYAFYNKGSIISFDELQYFTGLTAIGNSAFYHCSNLTSIILPDGITSIGESAFQECSSLTGDLVIPNSVTEIQHYAFLYCYGYNGSLTIGTNCSYIGVDGFYGTGFTTLNYNAVNCGTESYNTYHSFINCNETITTLNIGENVESIPDYVFYNFHNVTGSLTIPESVTSIGSYAFYGCSGLSGNLTIPNSVASIGYAAFSGCTGFTGDLTIGNSVTSIGEWAFNNCSGFTGNLTIGNSVATISRCAFSNCNGFTGDLVLPNSVETIGSSAFNNCSGFNGNLIISNSLATISSSVFYNCSGFTGDLVIPNSVATIGEEAFFCCSGFNGNLIIPNSVSTIGRSAFYNCSGFTGSLNIPNSVAGISSNAFDGCNFTGELIIPNSVEYIGVGAFRDCHGFTGTLTIGTGVTKIGVSAFRRCTGITTVQYNAINWLLPSGAYYDDEWYNSLDFMDYPIFNECENLNSVIIGEQVENIPAYAFYHCSGLRGELTLPESLVSVGYYAFAGCDEITTINYNATNCTVMGNAQYPVFYDCISVEHINIGANVQSIPNYAFKRCSTVVDMRVAAEVPPTIGPSTFGTVSRNIPVSVPIGSGEAYRTAQYWEEFFHITEDYSPSPYSYHWNVNVHQFADNMTVTGIIQIEGVEQAVPSLEIGAFCNGECRGRQLLTYYPQVDRYLVFLMLYGEDGDTFTFKLYDHEAGEELTAGCASVVTFESDAIVGSFLEPYVFNFTDMQLTQFSEGWNWWSTYVEQEGMDGLSLLEEGLGENGVTIRSQVGYTDYYAGYGWYGSLSSINNESSYKIKTSAPCVAAMAGGTAIPSEHPITLNQGWTWMGYLPSFALDINTALDGLEATLGDKVKSQQGYSDYYPGYGWFGSLNTIEPGMGLMYYSANGEAVTFTYPDGNRGGKELKANLTSENNRWVPNVHAYPDNMTVMAVVELNEEELNSENYELAAFAANGECRGSVKLMFVEPLNRYVAFLTISGKDAAELSFRLYDTETNDEYYDAEESLDFVANAIVGDADDLYVIHFRGTTGMDEFASRVKVYPNPINAGEQFSIGLAGDEMNSVCVEIINTMGMVETVWTPSRQTFTAPNVAGVYTLRITVEGKGTVVRKLVVK